MVIAADRIGLPPGRLDRQFTRLPVDQHQRAVLGIGLIHNRIDDDLEDPLDIPRVLKRLSDAPDQRQLPNLLLKPLRGRRQLFCKKVALVNGTFELLAKPLNLCSVAHSGPLPLRPPTC